MTELGEPHGETYVDYANRGMDKEDMESVVGSTEREIDVDLAITHNIYVGWVLGTARAKGVKLIHRGGNQFQLPDLPDINLVIPYPPETWEP